MARQLQRCQNPVLAPGGVVISLSDQGIRQLNKFQQLTQLLERGTITPLLKVEGGGTLDQREAFDKMQNYPRYITPGFPPFDPIELAKMTEKIVCRGSSRKYTGFYKVGVYGGISTGYTVGCCLRCIYCWVEWSRDFPESHGQFFTPKQAFQNLIFHAKKKRVSKLRISGGEPTVGKDHLLQVLEFVKTTNYLFILETNGILLGYDQEYAKSLDKFNRNLHVRVSLKAGTPEGFQKRTGAVGKFYELPYLAIKNLKETSLEYHVACMSDPRVMSSQERNIMLQKLKETGYHGYLEEEYCDPYPTAVVRLEKAGYHLFD